MTIDDAYAELGLSPGANLAQAKAAWRALVSRWHPDRNGHASASERMQRINRALEQIRSASNETELAGADANTAARPAAAPTPAHTIQRRVSLTLEEAAIGCVKILQGAIVEPCGSCAGSGEAPPHDCAACAGQGQVHERTWFGWFGAATPCTACDGGGTLRPKCSDCNGVGKTDVVRYRVSVRLPADVRDGAMLHVAAARGRPVALDIQVELQPHAALVRDADGTVRCECPVDGFAWIANRTITIPTLRGQQPLALQRGQVLYRLAGQGFLSHDEGKRADQIVIVVPRFPETLSREQERLLDKLAGTTQEKRAV
ncbi:MAG: DnaJ domain-containing protein [Burkholderiaceae bacterium]